MQGNMRKLECPYPRRSDFSSTSRLAPVETLPIRTGLAARQAVGRSAPDRPSASPSRASTCLSRPDQAVEHWCRGECHQDLGEQLAERVGGHWAQQLCPGSTVKAMGTRLREMDTLVTKRGLPRSGARLAPSATHRFAGSALGAFAGSPPLRPGAATLQDRSVEHSIPTDRFQREVIAGVSSPGCPLCTADSTATQPAGTDRQPKREMQSTRIRRHQSPATALSVKTLLEPAGFPTSRGSEAGRQGNSLPRCVRVVRQGFVSGQWRFSS